MASTKEKQDSARLTAATEPAGTWAGTGSASNGTGAFCPGDQAASLPGRSHSGRWRGSHGL